MIILHEFIFAKKIKNYILENSLVAQLCTWITVDVIMVGIVSDAPQLGMVYCLDGARGRRTRPGGAASRP